MTQVGDTLIYRLRFADAAQVARERDIRAAGASRSAFGSMVAEGDLLPMVVTRVWPNDTVSGQVLLDGNDALWVMGRRQGDQPGEWQPRDDGS